MLNNKKISSAVIGVASALLTSPAWAAGAFGLLEQGASGLGNAYANAAAGTEDASTIFYNAAGLSRLSGSQAVVAVHGIRPTGSFTPGAGTTPAAFQAGGDSGGDIGSLGVVPSAYFATEITPATRFGIGLNAPFGLQTQYTPTWVGRFQSIKSKIQAINLNPTLSWQVSDALSIGLGVNYQQFDGELSSAVNYSAAAFAAGGLPLLGAIGGPGVEGVSTVKGNDAGWGYNFGLLFNATPHTRFGLAYRSAIQYKLSGTVSFTNVPVLLSGSPLLANGPVTLDIKVPDTWSLGMFHQLNDSWDVMLDATRTGWSAMQQLNVVRTSGLAVVNVPENWRDTWRLSVGANHHYNDQWTVRIGAAYDQSPVPDATRHAMLPDRQRTWLAIGGQYKLSKQSALDFGYAHLFIGSAPINDNQAAQGKGSLVGTFDGMASDIVGLQYSHNW